MFEIIVTLYHNCDGIYEKIMSKTNNNKNRETLSANMGLPQYLMFDAPNIYDCLWISLTVPGGNKFSLTKNYAVCTNLSM